MKLKNLFEAKEKNLIGVEIDGEVIDETTPTKTWENKFVCAGMDLTSLYGSPREVRGRFNCDNNNYLTSLTGGPKKVHNYFSCEDNQLTTLEGAPTEIGGGFYCSFNELESLHNIHKHIKKMNGAFYATSNPIKSHVLGLMLIDGITDVNLDNLKVENILNHGIKNKKHWTEVQAELEEAGFEEYAQL